MDEIAMADFVKDLFKPILKYNVMPEDDPESESPCSKCIGSRVGCFLMHKRNPKNECGAFLLYDKAKNLKIEIED